MYQNIHSKILKRLLAVWVLLSLAIGTAVFFLEMEKVDDLVLALAIQESESFTADNLYLFNQPDADRSVLNRKAGEFLKNHFAIIELYNRGKQQILEAIHPGAESIEAELKKNTHAFPLADSTYYQKFFIKQKVFMQVLLPLKENNGAIAGYFEGVYQVDTATMRDIRERVLHSLLLVVVTSLATSVVFYPIIIALNRELMRFTRNLLKGNIELMEVLGSAIAKRDSDTNIHNYRVTLYAIRLAEAAGMKENEIRNLISGAFLHDVGKIGISDNILLKPGKLTEAEFQTMRTHVLLGVDILAKSKWLKNARDVVEFHHEKFDGSGYMRGLKGEEIPLNARIFAIVDVFDALTSKRPYKQPLSFDESMNILRQGRGTHFDPRLLDVFAVVALDLYTELGGQDDETIENKLTGRVNKHFFVP